MERMDANGNGILEPNEVSDRARGFLENMGLNPSRPINIQQAISGNAPRSSGGGSSGTAAASDPYALVPAFGDESVAGFGVTPTMLAGKLIKLEDKYDQRVLDSVSRSMERYDKNGNGLLERDEWVGIPWQGDPRESDLDKDGVLTKAELADRYAKRSRGEEESGGDRNARNRGGFFPGGPGGRGDGEVPNGGGRNRGGGDPNQGGRGGGRGGRGGFGGGGGPGGDENGGGGRRRGGGFDPASMLERFDEDGDGVINAEDLPGFAGGMLARFGIDTDKPIRIDDVRKAVEQQQNGGDPNSARRGRQPEKKKEIEPVASYKVDGASRFTARASFRPQVERPSGGPGWWTERDANKDGQVTLGEFLTGDSLNQIKEFEGYDINRDGIVTAPEAAVGK
jgi:Ca2+-binding EF-hand superfamily protein